MSKKICKICKSEMDGIKTVWNSPGYTGYVCKHDLPVKSLLRERDAIIKLMAEQGVELQAILRHIDAQKQS